MRMEKFRNRDPANITVSCMRMAWIAGCAHTTHFSISSFTTPFVLKK